MGQNISRWLGQFQSRGRKLTLLKGKAAQGDYYLADIAGTYNQPVGPPIFRKTKPLPNAKMLGVILLDKKAMKVFFHQVHRTGGDSRANAKHYRTFFGGDVKSEKEAKLPGNANSHKSVPTPCRSNSAANTAGNSWESPAPKRARSWIVRPVVARCGCRISTGRRPRFRNRSSTFTSWPTHWTSWRKSATSTQRLPGRHRPANEFAAANKPVMVKELAPLPRPEPISLEPPPAAVVVDIYAKKSRPPARIGRRPSRCR